MQLVFNKIESSYNEEDTNPFSEKNLNSSDTFESIIPIFKKYNTFFSSESQLITHFTVANGTAIIVTENNKILIYKNFPLQFSQKEEIDLTSRNYLVNKIFIHPRGLHVIFSTDRFDLVYFHIEKRQIVLIMKIQFHVSFICWNYNIPLLSKSFLVATYEGSLYEIQFDYEEGSVSTIKNIYRILNLFEEKYGQIKNKKIISVLTSYIESNKNILCFIATSQNLFRFVGQPSPVHPHMQPILSDNQLKNIIEIPSERTQGDFCVFPSYNSFPTHLAWITGSGVITCKIELNENFNKVDLKARKILRYTSNSSEFPIALKLTKYFCILLYPNRFMAINLLNEEISFNENHSGFYGKPVDMVCDGINGSIYYFTQTHIFGCHVFQEDRDIWKIMLEINEFSDALELTKDNPSNHDIVKQHIAQYEFDNKNYMVAADLFANTNAPLEQTAMQLFEIDSQYLIMYLSKKINDYENDFVQLHVLVIWIIDLYLIKMCSPLQDIDEFKTSFKSFIRHPSVKKCLEKFPKSYYRIVEFYENEEVLLFIASILKDYEKIIHYHLNNQQYFDAFQCLKQQNIPELWYKLSYEFFSVMPDQVVESWKELNEILDPKRVVQGILHVNLTKPNLMIALKNYLVYCIKTLKVKDSFIHNYLVSLYCASSEYGSVLEYLMKYSNPIYYDKHYLLQLSFQHKILKACTFILCKMNLYEEAVDLALNIDVQHSKECAKQAPTVNMRRKLWLIIATNTVKTQMDVDTAINFLNEAKVLKFEDLLPFFGDFRKIDTFKDAICESLKSYANTVDKQRLEIEKLAQISDNLRKRNEDIYKRSTHIEKSIKCPICKLAVLIKPFYTFPCGHLYHQVCYIKTYFHLSPFDQRKEIYDLIYDYCGSSLEFRKSSTANSYDNQSTAETSFDAVKNFENMLQTYQAALQSQDMANKYRETKKIEVDELMTKECIYCGEFSIDNIDAPLFKSPGFLDIKL